MDGAGAIAAQAEVSYAGRRFVFAHDNPNDHIFQILGQTGAFYEVELLEALRAYLGPGDLAVDVGANIGTHAVFFAAAAGAQVIAFEPNPQAVRLLERNVAANGLQNRIEIRACGLGEAAATAALTEAGLADNLGAMALRLDGGGPVQIHPLDSILLPAEPRLIKIDVEGMDLAVLRGARETLARARPTIAVEASERGQFDAIADLLEPLGYTYRGSFNYTPTHVFTPAAKGEASRAARRIALEAGRTYIAAAKTRALSDQRNAALTRKLEQMEAAAQALRAEVEALAARAEAPSPIEPLAAALEGLERRIDSASADLKAALESRAADLAADGRTALDQRLSAMDGRLARMDEALRRAQTDAAAETAATVRTLTERVERLIAAQEEAQRRAEARDAALLDALRAVRDASASQTERIARAIQNGADASAENNRALGAALDRSAQQQAAGLRATHARQSALEAELAALRAAFEEQGEKHATAVDALRDALQTAARTQLLAFAEELALLRRGLGATLRENAWAAEDLQAREALATRDALARMQRSYADALEGLAQGLRGQLQAAVLELVREIGAVRHDQAEVARGVEGALGVLRGETAQGLARVEDDIAASLAAQAAMPAWVERRLEALRGAAIAEFEQRLSALADRLQQDAEARDAAQQEAFGGALGDLLVDLERRMGPAPPLEPPPPRTFAAPLFDDAPAPLPPVLASVGLAATTVAAPVAEPAEPDVAAESLAAYDCAASWEKTGWPQEGAQLEPGGLIRAKAGARFPGVVGPTIAAAGGGVLRLRVNVLQAPEGASLVARIRTDENEPCGPDLPLAGGDNSVEVFAPLRTRQVKVYLLFKAPTRDSVARIGAVRLERLDIDSRQRRTAQRIGSPVLASMASIPSRRAMLADCVTSLLAQCDRVRVFLNGYPDVPQFLLHPRVEVRRSQDWDDRGDAGKFHWIDKDPEPGYRLITDDDLLFPPDFAETMCAKVAAADNRAIYCTHGVLLRQPVVQYYDDASSRAATFHFARALDEDRTVHIGATNALCFHSSAVSMKWADFLYCNSADIWISRYAQRQNLAMIVAARPQGWVRENRHEAPGETIYAHSKSRSRSRFDSSLVQDAALRQAWPLTMQPTTRPKLGLALLCSDAERAAACLASWAAARAADVDWVVFLIPEQAQGFREAAAALKVEHETHLLLDHATLADGVQAARGLARRLGVEAALYVSDGVRFAGPGWEAAAFGDAPGVRALLNGAQGPLVSAERFVAGSAYGLGAARLSISDDRASHAAALKAALVAPAPAPALPAPRARGKRINDMFERVLTLNLDRRPDRWALMRGQLAKAGIRAERFSATDGADAAIAAEYDAYRAQPLTPFPAHTAHLKYSEDFYIRPPCQTARVAQIEQSTRAKAIASRGAWGYLRSWRRILEQALTDQVETLLVFDDDVLFHRDTERLFAQAADELPPDWLIFQLGTLQYNWKAPWFEPASAHLYRTNGAAIGSHAVGLRFEILPVLLDHVNRMDMPFDVGALSAATHAFKDRAFVMLPNVAIQRLGGDSDISTSDFQKRSRVEEIAATYRWTLTDYFPDDAP